MLSNNIRSFGNFTFSFRCRAGLFSCLFGLHK